MTALAITLGSVFSLLAYDVLGLAAGGIVVPGYLALELNSPGKIAGLLLVTLAVYGSNQILARHMLLFGRRQLVVSVLTGCLLAQGLRLLLPAIAFTDALDMDALNMGGHGLEAMGWVIPGLVAYWCGRQGVVKTLSALFLTSAMVRLTLIVATGGNLMH